MMEQNPDMNQSTNSGVESGKAMLTPLEIGTVLREARENSGMSVNDVATRLKFAPRQISALEGGDFASLHGPTFIRGFVRSYARLLQLDEGALLEALPSASTNISRAENKDQGAPFPSAYAARRSNILWLASALLVAVALVIFVWQRDEGQVESRKEVKVVTAPVAVSAVNEAMPVSAPAAAVPAADEVRVEAEPAPVKETEQSQQPEVAPEAETEKKQDWKLAPLVTIKPESAVQGADMLRIVCDEDSWLEVRDGNGTVLLSQICTGGSGPVLNRAPPYYVVFGNAKGVRLYFKGQQIDLAPYTRMKVARLALK